MIRIGVTGAAGRMGSTIIRLAGANKEFSVQGAFEHAGHPALGKSAADKAVITDLKSSSLKGLDVLIDFTAPEATVQHAGICADSKCGIVIGTTGLTPEQNKKIQGYAEKIPVLMSPNMSLGANLIFKLAKEAAQVPEFAKKTLPGNELRIIVSAKSACGSWWYEFGM